MLTSQPLLKRHKPFTRSLNHQRHASQRHDVLLSFNTNYLDYHFGPYHFGSLKKKPLSPLVTWPIRLPDGFNCTLVVLDPTYHAENHINPVWLIKNFPHFSPYQGCHDGFLLDNAQSALANNRIKPVYPSTIATAIHFTNLFPALFYGMGE